MKSIEVTLAGRRYPVKVTEEEELLLREVVKEANTMVSDFQNTYRNKDKQDCLSMALLTYALEAAKGRRSTSDLEEATQRTRSIQQILAGIS